MAHGTPASYAAAAQRLRTSASSFPRVNADPGELMVSFTTTGGTWNTAGFLATAPDTRESTVELRIAWNARRAAACDCWSIAAPRLAIVKIFGAGEPAAGAAVAGVSVANAGHCSGSG